MNDGSLQVNHKGMIFTADSLTVRSPDDEESSDSRRRPFFYVLISLAAVIGAVFLIVIVCKVYFVSLRSVFIVAREEGNGGSGQWNQYRGSCRVYREGGGITKITV